MSAPEYSDEIIEQKKKEKVKEILSPYFSGIRAMMDDLRKQEFLIDYYTSKISEIKANSDAIYKDLELNEKILNEKFLDAVENQNFYLSPYHIELKEISEKARNKKKELDMMENNYATNSMEIDNMEQSLKEEIASMPEEDIKLYLLLKDIIMNDKDINDYINDYEISDIENGNQIIKENKLFFKDAKKLCKNKKDNIEKIKKIIEDNKRKDKNKANNHFNFKDNLTMSRYKRMNNFYNNPQEKSFSSLEKNLSCCSLPTYNQTNRPLIGNPNKTFYLKLNKVREMKSQSMKKNEYFDENNDNLCFKLARNYKNELTYSGDIDRKRKNNSLDRSLYKERKNKREVRNNALRIATDSVDGRVNSNLDNHFNYKCNSSFCTAGEEKIISIE